MSPISAKLRRFVIHRARGRCEYCRLAQVGQAATYHVDHIVPVSAGGPTKIGNLAWACVNCSLRKGARRAAVDPATGMMTMLFHPRRDKWHEHFHWSSHHLVGLTPVGRSTVAALNLNDPGLIQIRRDDAQLGRHPPPNLA